MTKKKLSFLETVEEEFEDAFESILVSEEMDSKIEVIPTSSVSLNVSIGIGGIPKGKFTEIFGAEASGKTTLALDICKNAMAGGGKVLYIDAEHGMSYEYSKQIIGDYDEANLIILQPETAEECFKLTEDGIQSGEFSLIIIDSIGALAPLKEKEDKFEDSQVSLLPRIISKFLRRNHHAVKVNKVAIIFINQLRDKIGTYVKMYDTPGGHALKHIASLRIYLWAGDKIKGGDEIIGNEVEFVIKKNKLAAPFRSFKYSLIFGKGIDSVKDVLDFANKLGIIQTRGAYYYFDDVQIGQGSINTSKTLFENPELLDKIIKACYNVLNIEKENNNG